MNDGDRDDTSERDRLIDAWEDGDIGRDPRFRNGAGFAIAFILSLVFWVTLGVIFL